MEGNGSAWTQGDDGSLTFRANGDFAKFTGIRVDGKDVSADNYTAVSGSTVVTLKMAYLDSLPEGEHTLTVVYQDGECSAAFEVKPSPAASIPQTGDESHVALWFALLLISGGALITTTVLGKKRKTNG